MVVEIKTIPRSPEADVADVVVWWLKVARREDANAGGANVAVRSFDKPARRMA